MNFWNDPSMPPVRQEALYGDRVVNCYQGRPRGLSHMLAQALRHHGEREALVFEDKRLTYQQLDREVERVACGLSSLDIQAGERVALFMGNSAMFVVVLLAVQRMGAIAVPIGEREQSAGVAYILEQCSTSAIVFDERLADKLPEGEKLPHLKARFVCGNHAGAIAMDSFPEPPPGASLHAPVAEQDTSVILYTSGTTGQPKGAMLTHLGISHSVMHFQTGMSLTAEDRCVLAVPGSHVTGLIACIATMLQVGGTLIVLREFKAPAFLALAVNERMTYTLAVPAMYKLMLLSEGLEGHDLSHWRVGGYGGAPMSVALIDALGSRFPGLTLTNAYGATELTSPATMMPKGRTRSHADSVGVALPCAEILIMGEDGKEMPSGEVGELWIGGPMVVPGYWNNPKATAENFTAGFWHSGDLGLVDGEGFVKLVDRKKDMLNRGGFKIYSAEVEGVLGAFPGVVEAAIVGRPCPVLGERVHAFVYARGIEHDDAAVKRYCAARLANYKVPETFTWSDAPLPRNAGGKLLKRTLREQDAPQAAVSAKPL